ncbi:MAG: prenyltransferase [Nitrososphaerales archaeon]
MAEWQSVFKSSSKLEIFFRLTRIQFIPLIILPALVGTSIAWLEFKQFNALYFALVLLGVSLLHLGANSIDDVYDYANGVDQIANSMFPKEFGGWKPLPRRLISLRGAKLISALLFGSSLVIGIYFWRVMGFWALGLALGGVALATVYTAPPFKLDYRGFALGEISILFSFGPIPVLGAFFVQTGALALNPLLVSIPIGLMTVTILVDHDLIFYEAYKKSGKQSLGTVLGRKNALKASLAMTLVSYLLVVGLALANVIPVWTLLAPLMSALILARKARAFSRSEEPPSYYVPFTTNGLISNWTFALVLALTLLL